MTDIFSELRGAFNRRNNGLMKLILINIVVFLVLASVNVVLYLAGQSHITHYLLDWISLSPDFFTFLTRPWTLITYGFTHDLKDIFHILFNMLALYWMGKLIQEYIGSHRLLAIYILGVLFGAFFFIGFYNVIPILIANQQFVHLVGASGGVYAVVVAAATLAPETIVLLFGLLPVRLKYIAWFMIFVSFIQLATPNTGGNAAHLGGALLGYLFVVQLRKGNDWGKPINRFLEWWGGLFAPKPKMKVTYIKQKATVTKNSSQGKQAKPEQILASGTVPSQEELDFILDKISAKGYESLSKEEKQKLFNASRHD